MIYTEEELNLILLSSFIEITYNERLALLKSFLPDGEEDRNLLIKRRGIGVYNKVKEQFFNPDYRESVLKKLQDGGIRCITLASPDYPERLKKIPNPPMTLYALGNISLLKERAFAVVGSRRTSTAMLAECKKFVSALKEHFIIVSGSATGADAAALEEAKARGVSVLAYGFDHINSSGEYRLLNEIKDEGLIISEYFPTAVARTYNFPVRNRIIAGLSEGALIISAAKKSGALITADLAAKQNKKVFAFPYSLGVSGGEGCNDIIKNGAILCRNPLDILSEFGLDLKPRKTLSLTEEEEKIYSIIKEEGEALGTAIAEKLGLPSHKLIPALSSLEIKGLIVRIGGGRYSTI